MIFCNCNVSTFISNCVLFLFFLVSVASCVYKLLSEICQLSEMGQRENSGDGILRQQLLKYANRPLSKKAGGWALQSSTSGLRPQGMATESL